jgi:hypothetical protein
MSKIRFTPFCVAAMLCCLAVDVRAQPIGLGTPKKTGKSGKVVREGKPGKGGRPAPKKKGANKQTPPAKQGDVVGVLDVATVGVSEIAAEKFEASLEEGLKLHGFRVAKRQRMQEYLQGSDYRAGCLFGPCLREVHRRTRGEVPLVLVARITGEGSSYRFLISLLDTRSGVPTAQIPTSCEVCTVEEAIAAATLAVIELVAGIGESSVLDPRGATGGATSDKADMTPSEGRSKFKRATKITSTILYVAGGLAGATGLVFFAGGSDEAGWLFLGGGAGLLAGSGTLWLVSKQF